jgi:hypothetical protein
MSETIKRTSSDVAGAIYCYLNEQTANPRKGQAAQLLEAAMEHLERMDWVSVIDVLPARGRWVSVWIKLASRPCSARRDDGGWTLENNGFIYDQEDRVTHWMPFPEPPCP